MKAFGDPSDDYSASWVDFDESGMNGWRYGDDGWVSIFWGVSCQGVKGNDQLVIAYEVDNPYNYVTSDPGSSGTVPTASANARNTDISFFFSFISQPPIIISIPFIIYNQVYHIMIITVIGSYKTLYHII